ncbi:MAG: hypothetical protein ACOC8H_02005, partial [bacterium]
GGPDRGGMGGCDIDGKGRSLRLKKKLEKYCPVSASLSCPVSIQIIVRESTGDCGERGSDRS